ncbi:hypothetical protein [Saccharothrix sp.]|uniref:hypothetical protein n=1 Tax=Saccharothrix sp. TaxID=1873460 RepID=UPI0028116854|nr:hypothetical protein [Saccharothrix sp.]
MTNPHLIAPIHHRTGIRPVPLGFFVSPRRARARSRELDDAHAMFRELALRLDYWAYMLRRNALDVDALLDIACRADHPTPMREAVKAIAAQLRFQAETLEIELNLRVKAPAFAALDQQAEGVEYLTRPSLSLTADARYLRRIADLIVRDARSPRPPVRQLREGEHIVRFWNAINGEDEKRYCDDVQAARELAATHRPYNDTGVEIRFVTAVTDSTVRTEHVPLHTSHA